MFREARQWLGYVTMIRDDATITIVHVKIKNNASYLIKPE
jgi:hypothetical protein